jgi:hypothetical protein
MDHRNLFHQQEIVKLKHPRPAIWLVSAKHRETQTPGKASPVFGAVVCYGGCSAFGVVVGLSLELRKLPAGRRR